MYPTCLAPLLEGGKCHTTPMALRNFSAATNKIHSPRLLIYEEVCQPLLGYGLDRPRDHLAKEGRVPSSI